MSQSTVCMSTRLSTVLKGGLADSCESSSGHVSRSECTAEEAFGLSCVETARSLVGVTEPHARTMRHYAPTPLQAAGRGASLTEQCNLQADMRVIQPVGVSLFQDIQRQRAGGKAAAASQAAAAAALQRVQTLSEECRAALRERVSHELPLLPFDSTAAAQGAVSIVMADALSDSDVRPTCSGCNSS